VNLAANNTLSPQDILQQLDTVKTSLATASTTSSTSNSSSGVAVFHLGYPHFLPLIQGTALKQLMTSVRTSLGGPLISLVSTFSELLTGSAVLFDSDELLRACFFNVQSSCVACGLYSQTHTLVFHRAY
jgi:hypothetical protein